MFFVVTIVRLALGYYSSRPMVTATQWQNLIDYYTATSPDNLPSQKRKKKINMGLSLFTVQSSGLYYKNAHTSFVNIGHDSTKRH